MKVKKFFPLKLPKFSLNEEKRLQVLIILTVFVAIFLGYHFKLKNRILGKFLAGVVNGQPIYRSELTKRLYSRYGNPVLESLIVDILVRQEAKAKEIKVTQEDLEGVIGRIKEQLGENADLDSVLASQGIKRSEFEEGIRVEVMVRKLLEKEITVAEEEISKFIKENKKTMEATSEPDLRQEARQILADQKISQKINSWIAELEKKAKIERFIR
jgi:parvulin-like peptidyl-prolyl isomerase